MKPVSDVRKLDIAYFSTIVRRAGARLVPQGSDAERIRQVAAYLDASVPTVKTWWYAQNCPRGGAAKVILRELEKLSLD